MFPAYTQVDHMTSGHADKQQRHDSYVLSYFLPETDMFRAGVKAEYESRLIV